jgi:hypothetical protein
MRQEAGGKGMRREAARAAWAGGTVASILSIRCL